jgi:hypothetical protein
MRPEQSDSGLDAIGFGSALLPAQPLVITNSA